MLASCTSLLMDKLDPFKQKTLTGSDIVILGRKVEDAESKMNDLMDGLSQDIFDACASVAHNVDQDLLAVGTNLKELVAREKKDLQQSADDTLCIALGGVLELLCNAPGIVDGSSILIFGHESHDDYVRPGSCTSNSVSRESRRGRSRVTLKRRRASMGITSQGSAPASPGATDLCDYRGRPSCIYCSSSFNR